jgi:hypothetical protein
MPRHRIERQPRHRAQRPTQERDRRVQLRAVPNRPSPSHAKPPEGPRAADRLAEFGAQFWPYQRRLLTGATRGLLVSPWFAAGAGFVIAAGAFIYAPHGELFLTEPGVKACDVAGCHSLTQDGGTLLTPKGGATPIPTTPPATTGLAFTYSVNRPRHGAFRMQLTVRASHAIGDWRLFFVIPGATDVSVADAAWQQSGTNGGTASNFGSAGADNTSAYDQQNSGHSGNQGYVGTHPGGNGDQQDYVSFTVTGFGQPSAPENCSFNGAPCSFNPI